MDDGAAPMHEGKSVSLSINDLLSNDVKKPTALVHFERDMSLTEQKVMTLIIFHCQVADKDERGLYYIKKSFVRRFLGWDDSNNYPRIYEAFEKIFDNTIKWNLLGKDKTFKSLRCKLIVSLLEPTESGQFIGFKIHPDLEPVIKDPRLFAKIKLIMMSILAKPKYAFPLYEILSDCYSRGEKSARLSLRELKESLGIMGPYYDNFVAFKKEILKPNLAIINQNTDCVVTYETYREGRKIAGVVFALSKQAWHPPLLQEHIKELQIYYKKDHNGLNLLTNPLPGIDEQLFLDSVKMYHITEIDALQAIKTHGLEGAVQIRDYVLQQAARYKEKKDGVRDIGAYMMRCFREGYGKKNREKYPANPVPKLTDSSSSKTLEKSITASDTQAFHIGKEFREYQGKLVDEILDKMSPEERGKFNEQFAHKNPIWANKFREFGLKTPMMRSAFYKFAVDRLLAPEYLDIAVFARNKGVSEQIIEILKTR